MFIVYLFYIYIKKISIVTVNECSFGYVSLLVMMSKMPFYGQKIITSFMFGYQT